MASKNVTSISTRGNPADEASPDELLRDAAEHRTRADELELRARVLQADQRTKPKSLRVIAEEMNVSLRPLHDAAIRGDLEAWRIGGKERGELVTTWAAVTAYLAKRPAATPKPAASASSADVYELAVAHARGKR